MVTSWWKICPHANFLSPCGFNLISVYCCSGEILSFPTQLHAVLLRAHSAIGSAVGLKFTAQLN